MSNFGNAILYKMCADYPHHDDVDVIAGKIWLIGHSYSAAVNRVRNSSLLKDVENFIADTVAPTIKQSNIDEWIAKVRAIDRLTHDNCEQVLALHKNFTDVLKQITDLNKRSLASKYLHFHLPNAVFIYDFLANRSITHLNQGKKHDIPQNYDADYSVFVKRCLVFRDEIFEPKLLGRQSTPRELDVYLLKYKKFLDKNSSGNLELEQWQQQTIDYIQKNQSQDAKKNANALKYDL